MCGAKEAQFVRCSADTNTRCEREREARAELAFPIINRVGKTGRILVKAESVE